MNETGEKIMKVALKLFSEQGYYSTTTKQIAKKAGVNELTVFRHFKNKANLFQVTTECYVLESHIDAILDGTNELCFDEAMIIITKRIYDLFVLNIKLYKVQLKLSDNEKDFIKLKLSRELNIILQGYFKKQIEKNQIVGDIEIMAVTLLNSLLGMFTVDILTNNTFTNIPMEKVVEEHTKQFITAYKK